MANIIFLKLKFDFETHLLNDGHTILAFELITE